MIKTRLFSLVQGAGALVAQSVALQWLSLVTNAIMVFTLATLLQDLFLEGFSLWRLLAAVGVCVVVESSSLKSTSPNTCPNCSTA